MFRVLWGVYLLAVAIVMILGAVEVIDLGISLLGQVMLVILFAIILFSSYKLFWFGVFLPIAIVINILDASFGWSLNGTAIAAIYVVAFIVSIAFTVLFHKKGSWQLVHKETPKTYLQHSDGNAEKVASKVNSKITKKTR
jgi:predicted membrane protein